MSEEIAKSKMCCPCRVIEVRVKELEALLKSSEVGDIGVHDEVVHKQLVNFMKRCFVWNKSFKTLRVESWVNSIENLFELLNVTRDSVKISIAIQETIYNRFWSSDIVYETQVELYELVQGDMDVESYIAKFEELCLNGNNNDLNEVLVNRAIWKKCNDNWRERGVALEYTPHCVESNVDHVFRTIGAIDWVDNLIVTIDGVSNINYISEEFVRVNHMEVNDLSEPYKLRWLHGGMELSVTQSVMVDLRIGDLVSSESLDIVPMKTCDVVMGLPFIKKLGMVFVGSLNVFSYRDHENRVGQKVFLLVGGPRLFPFKKRIKFVVRTWPSLEYSPTPSSGNNEVEEESLNHQQVSEESSDFPSTWNDSSDKDSNDVQGIDTSEFVPKSKRLEEIDDTHSNTGCNRSEEQVPQSSHLGNSDRGSPLSLGSTNHNFTQTPGVESSKGTDAKNTNRKQKSGPREIYAIKDVLSYRVSVQEKSEASSRIGWRSEHTLGHLPDKRGMVSSLAANRYNMREWDEKSCFVQEDVWASFKKHWESESFQKVRRMNSSNRKSSKKGPVIHTGRSVSFVEDAARLYNAKFDLRVIIGRNMFLVTSLRCMKYSHSLIPFSMISRPLLIPILKQFIKSAHSDVAVQSKKLIQDLTSKVEAYVLKMDKMQTVMEKWQKTMEMWCKQNGVPFLDLDVEDDQTLQGLNGQND
ncbi:OLC1v1016297C1 [Oldenlandia corymbosa var. corymbosa]|uniref:OLC1v1016297C1 n=1 Tax=Oldenlandia corymbosa var. corymbosa TaxID=529605 RepID=A0AAV1E7C7_OLDCO|nr:OLC1v1016297C1 [Oldenlandia corymbosa var. corymbosa]